MLVNSSAYSSNQRSSRRALSRAVLVPRWGHAVPACALRDAREQQHGQTRAGGSLAEGRPGVAIQWPRTLTLMQQDLVLSIF